MAKNEKDTGKGIKTDEMLIWEIRKGDLSAQDLLFSKYKNVVKGKSRAYFLMGADNEDVIQEGMIGLYKAVRDFEPDRGVSFSTFAEVCISRQILSAVKAATRRKHMPLNTYISLNKPIDGNEYSDMYIDSLKGDEASNPESMYIEQENKLFIEEKLSAGLSDFEYRVLSLYLKGKSYYEIAEITGKSYKSVDNALQRLKRKTEKLMEAK